MDMTHYWDDTNTTTIQRLKFEGCNSSDELNNRGAKEERPVFQCCDTNLNFSTATCSEDDSEYSPFKKNKVTRQDPMSHRIIEKRRRDRMNNCLADLSRLIPTEYLKKGRGRIEKTEIIEMAIKHMKYLQQEHNTPTEHFRMGYQECMSEAMRFMVEVEGHFPREGICLRILNHLQKHCDSLRIAHQPSPHPPPTHHPIVDHGNNQSINNNSAVRGDETILIPGHHDNYHQLPKLEPSNNSGSNNGSSSNGSFTVRLKESEVFEKHPECNGNGVSYKYKTDIKMRFSQDLNEAGMKRQKLTINENGGSGGGRRESVTSVDNQSSSHSSPPSSDLLTRISENEAARSPTESNQSLNLKMEPNGHPPHHHHHHSQQPNNYNAISSSPPPPIIPSAKHHLIDNNDKANFNVPIFALHAKGSFYLPLTIDYKTLLPYLHNCDIVEMVPNSHNNVVLHPVTINVNFQPNNINNNFLNGKYKSEFNNNNHIWN